MGFTTLDAALSGPPEAGSGPTRDGFGRRPDEDRSRASAGATGRRRAARLLELCEGAVPPPGGATDVGAGRPQLLVRVDLSTLLDRDQLPAQLLTTLTGGRMWASPETARICDADHARPWHPPIGAEGPPGRTDVDELAPPCRTDNGTKERDGWRAIQHPDGSRTRHHPRSGLTTRTTPARWRPPPLPDITERPAAPP